MRMSIDEYKKTAKKRYNYEEDELAKDVNTYLLDLMDAGEVLEFTHISNETYTKYWSVKVKNTQMGVRPGMPDFCIIFRSRILFLELKREKGGTLSDHQKRWIEAIRQSGHHAEVAHGWDEAKAAIDAYR